MLRCVPYGCVLPLSSSFVMQIYLQKKYSEAEMETWENPVSLGSKESTSSSMGRVCAMLSYSTACYRRLHSLQLFFFSFRQMFQTKPM